ALIASEGFVESDELASHLKGPSRVLIDCLKALVDARYLAYRDRNGIFRAWVATRTGRRLLDYLGLGASAVKETVDGNLKSKLHAAMAGRPSPGSGRVFEEVLPV